MCSCQIQLPQKFHPGKSKGFPSNITALDVFVTDPDPFRTKIQQLAPLLVFQAINLPERALLQSDSQVQELASSCFGRSQELFASTFSEEL